MFTARQGKQLTIITSNQIGALKHVSKIIGEKGISILCVNCSVYDMIAIFHVVTDDNLRAKEALTAKKFDVTEEDVILIEVPHKPGLLKQMTERLEKAGIDLRHLYATARVNDDHCLVVVSSTNNAKALTELNR